MISLSYVRAVIRTAACVAVSLAAPASFAAEDAPRQAQAQFLDQAKYLCTNCFFGASRYYYCFQADNEILVGYQKTPVLNWEDNTKNYLTSVNPRWDAWTPSGQTLPIRYNEKHIWVSRSDGSHGRHGFVARVVGGITRSDKKPVRLTRSRLRDIFMNNDLCHGSDVGKTR